MKRNILIGSCVLLASVLNATADTKDTVISAAHKLADKSYTYTSTPKSAGGGGGGGGKGGKGFQPGPTEGEVEKGGLVKLSRTVGQFTSESYIKGDKAVTKTPDGWKTVQELLEAAKQGGGGGGKGKGGFAAIAGLRGYKSPAEQAADLAEKAKDLKEADGAISGELPESAVKELAAPGGRGGKGPEMEGAKGSVKF